MRRSMWIGFWGILLGVSAHAASFDCAKARSNVEKMICADAELSKLDDDLAVTYKTALQNQAKAKAIQEAQRLWLKERNSCSDEDCISRSYQARANVISAGSKITPISDNTKKCRVGEISAGKYIAGADEGYPVNTLLLTKAAGTHTFHAELISFWSCKRNDDGSCTNVSESKGELRFKNCIGNLTDPDAPNCNTSFRITSEKSIFVTQKGVCLGGYNATPIGEYFAQ